MNGIDLTIIDNTITNIDEIITYLKDAEIDFNFSEHLKTLKNNLSSKNITNKDLLEDVINTKLIEYEMASSQQTDNITTLKILQETNEEFKKMSIIQTPPEKNDSNQYIDYITFTNENGSLEVLCCDSENFLNNFIQSHKREIQSYSSKDLFRHFKEYVHRELKFTSREEYERNEEMNQSSIVREDQIEAAEYEAMEDYKNRYSIQSNIEITVDQFGERLYRLGDGLFTFKTINGERVMETLKTPTLNRNNVDDLLSELDSPEELPEVAIIKPIEEGDKAKVDDSYGNIENIDADSFDEEYFKEITAKRDVYDVELTASEEHRLNVYIKYLITKMANDANKGIPFNHDTELIYDYIESPRGEKTSIIATYENIKLGYSNENELSDLDKEFANHYLENKEKMKALGLDRTNDKKLELNMSKPDESGVSTIVVLMEIIILAMFVIMILRLDI